MASSMWSGAEGVVVCGHLQTIWIPLNYVHRPNLTKERAKEASLGCLKESDEDWQGEPVLSNVLSFPHPRIRSGIIKPAVGVLDLASNVTEGDTAFHTHNVARLTHLQGHGMPQCSRGTHGNG